jgi:hypothetical protein
MKAETGRLPDLILEQYALGELSKSETARVESLLAAEPALRERLDTIRRSDEEILEEAPPAEIAAAIWRRMLASGNPVDRSARAGVPADGAKAGRFRPAAAFAFPAAAAVLVLVGAVMARGILLPSQGEGIRAKGGSPAIFVYRKSPSGPLALADGAAASAGDLLQIKYSAGGARYGAIASLDGKGSLTWHLPSGSAVSGARAPRLEEGGAALASAYELDDAPSFERFFILSSKDSFDLSLAASALRDLAGSGRADTGSPKLPAGLEYKSLLLRKTPR